MTVRRSRRGGYDELDWLIARSLHDLAQTAEPPPRVWQNVRAAIAAQDEEVAVDRASWLWSILRWVAACLMVPRSGEERLFLYSGCLFRDVTDTPSRFVWWPHEGAFGIGLRGYAVIS